MAMWLTQNKIPTGFICLLLLLLVGCSTWLAPSSPVVVATPIPRPVGYTPPCPAATVTDVTRLDNQNAYTCVTVVATVRAIDCSLPVSPTRCIGLLTEGDEAVWVIYPTDQNAPRIGQRIEVKGYVVFLDFTGDWALLVTGWREIVGSGA